MVKAAMELGTHQKNRPLNPINNTKARRLTYLKRKDCIKKKTMELGILCGTDTCTIILGPDGEVETWPENQTQVKSIIRKYRECGKKSALPTSEKTNPNVGLLGWDDDWVSGLSVGELWSLLGDLDLKLEAVENRVGLLNVLNKEQGKNRVGFLNVLNNDEQGNGLDFPLNYWPMEQSVEPLVSGYPCFPLNAQPSSFYGVLDHQFVPVAENHLQPFSMDETLLGLGNGFLVEPVGTPSGEALVSFDGDSYQNVGNYANDYTQKFIPRDEFYSQISPLAEALLGTSYGNPTQFVDNEFGEGAAAAFNFNNCSSHCSQGELQLW
ncbi:agamous-like MADS-box protein MADS9 [Rhododendron vialii]|uniref:agamous-like MADS-box protein MADS9 n=1 Tax=Rhododendron vialii TaxID=182163 RepID=UPI00265F19DD|nr:agamous-like MADS-box protein MADS9 [Rhododendron vialii]